MRATTLVLLAAGWVMGAMVVAASMPVEEPTLGGGAAQMALGHTPLDTIVGESLRHAQEADAAIADGRLRLDPTPPSPSQTDAPPPDAPDWQPPLHDLPPGVYHDPHSLLVVGPRWVYEWRAMPLAWNHGSATGLVPEASMGYLDGDHFVRWAAGEGWLPDDVAGLALARRRTRLYRDGRDVCLDAQCTRRLRFSSTRKFEPSPLDDLMRSGANPFERSHRIGDIVVTTSEYQLSTGQHRSRLSFSISWIDAQRVTQFWGTSDGSVGDVSDPFELRLTRRRRLMPPHPSTVRQGWPLLGPEQVRCTCPTDRCAPDDRSVHIVAAREIERSGLPFSRGPWRCDRTNASRRWALRPLGLTGEAILEREPPSCTSRGRALLKLTAPQTQAAVSADVPTQFVSRDATGQARWHFTAMTDGTLWVQAASAAQPITLYPVR